MIELPGMEYFRHDMARLALAFVLSSLIGLEREYKLKSAGLRTHALVGLGTAVLMVVSKRGFADVVMGQPGVSFDPSRVAAQIVTGIGFIGAGLIFVRKDIVHGLTTAATIWLTAGVGMASGGDLPQIALAATAGHFVIVVGFTPIMRRLIGSTSVLHIRYTPGRDVAAAIVSLATRHEFVIRNFTVESDDAESPSAEMTLQLVGTKPMVRLAEALTKVPGVLSVDSKRSTAGE